MAEAQAYLLTQTAKHIERASNWLMKGLLRSPFHRLLSRDVMLFTFTGRKSGKIYTTPVTYLRDGDEVLVFTPSKWWKNLLGGAPVTLYIQKQEMPGTAQPYPDTADVVAGIQRYLHLKGYQRARWIGVRLDSSREPTHDELTRAAQNFVLVRIKI